MKKIISACGNDCSICPRYMPKNHQQLRRTAELWYEIKYRDKIISDDEIMCNGCTKDNVCRYNIALCCDKNDVINCGECSSYPCDNIRDAFIQTMKFEPDCRKFCTDEEYSIMSHAFFEKKKNLNQIYANRYYIFRKAAENDKDGILSLYHSLIGTSGCTWNYDYPSMFEIEDDIKKSSLYCLCENSHIIASGYAGESHKLDGLKWSDKIKTPCEMARICVDSELQGRGIGEILLEHMFADVQKRGFDGVRILVSKTNLSAQALYKKCGFSCCGEAFMYGLDFFCYEISLK